MPIAQVDHPVYNLCCNACGRTADEGGDGVLYFHSIEAARRWAYDEGWDDNCHWPDPVLRCPACIAKDEPAEQAAQECTSPSNRRLACGCCPHQVCEDCERCGHNCICPNPTD